MNPPDMPGEMIPTRASRPPLNALVPPARRARTRRAMVAMGGLPATPTRRTTELIIGARGPGDGPLGVANRKKGPPRRAARIQGLGDGGRFLPLGLPLGAAGARGRRPHPIVEALIPEPRVGPGVENQALVTPDLKFVGPTRPRPPPKKPNHPTVPPIQVGRHLGPGRLGVGEVRGPEHGNEDLRRADLTRVWDATSAILSPVDATNPVAPAMLPPRIRRDPRLATPGHLAQTGVELELALGRALVPTAPPRGHPASLQLGPPLPRWGLHAAADPLLPRHALKTPVLERLLGELPPPPRAPPRPWRAPNFPLGGAAEHPARARDRAAAPRLCDTPPSGPLVHWSPPSPRPSAPPFPITRD